MDSVAISASPRTATGKKATKANRIAGQIPCVIYGGEKVIHFLGKKLDFRDLIYTGAFKLAEVTIDGTTYKCIIQEVQFHPVTDEIQHVDFLQLIDGQPLKVEIPLKFRGVAPGVKNGGTLNQKVRKIKIKTVPASLVPELFVDISALKLNESVRVRDVEVTKEMEVMNSPGIPVASVETPRALRSAEAEEEEEEEAAAAAAAAAEGGDAAEGAE